MKTSFYLLLSAFCLSAHAASIATTKQGIVIAHDHRIELVDGWNVDGVANPGKIIVGDDRVAVLDSLNNEAVIVANGVATRARTSETPIDGVFAGRDLYVLDRDARVLERLGGNNVALADDPAFVRASNGRLYVYSRTAGVLQEITINPFAVARTTHVAPFASAFETDGRDAYLVYPRDAKLRVVALDTMQPAGEIAAGAVPVDVAITAPTALTARTLAVADPSGKRVWVVEGRQSFAQAFARGFLRAFIGLGLFGNRDSQFPTGVDRIVIGDNIWLAYDTSSGTLYRFTKSKSSVIAQNVGPNEFTVRHEGIFIWDRTVRRLQRIGVDE